MKKIIFDNQNFNIKDTLECGQVFRYHSYDKGYKVYSTDRCAYLYHERESVVIECLDKDEEYFKNYFDLSRDYNIIVKSAIESGVEILQKCANLGKGIRILNQDQVETLFSFIVSQNNNIPRIKGIIEKLCLSLGEKKEFLGQEYYAFPTVEKMSSAPLKLYTSIGLGYRAQYIKRLAQDIANGFDINAFSNYDTPLLKKTLVSIYGVGPKVADCVTLFGYHRSDSFPVDTWIAKVYEQDFKGELKDRNKMSKYFVDTFGEHAGYFQQYLFYYKRSLEREEKPKNR